MVFSVVRFIPHSSHTLPAGGLGAPQAGHSRSRFRQHSHPVRHLLGGLWNLEIAECPAGGTLPFQVVAAVTTEFLSRLTVAMANRAFHGLVHIRFGNNDTCKGLLWDSSIYIRIFR